MSLPDYAIREFWSQVAIGGLDECWPWQGSIAQRDGYGRFHSEGTLYAAHRVAYELARLYLRPGQPVHHKCGMRLCVNPLHMQVFPNHSTHMKECHQ